jgi:hypothetical protein
MAGYEGRKALARAALLLLVRGLDSFPARTAKAGGKLTTQRNRVLKWRSSCFMAFGNDLDSGRCADQSWWEMVGWTLKLAATEGGAQERSCQVSRAALNDCQEIEPPASGISIVLSFTASPIHSKNSSLLPTTAIGLYPRPSNG